MKITHLCLGCLTHLRPRVQRALFPRLFFMDDADMIALQYSCVNDETRLKHFLPILFDSIFDIHWSSMRILEAQQELNTGPSSDFSLSSERYPKLEKAPTPVFQPQRIGALQRTMSGAFHVPSEDLAGDFMSTVQGDPRMSRSRPAGVIDIAGQVMLFNETSINASDEAESTTSSPRFVGLDAADSKLHRFLNLVLSGTTEELKQDLVEARDKLLLAVDKGMSMHVDSEQFAHIISAHSPQNIHLCLRLVWTASVQQMFDSAGGSANSVIRHLESSSTGLVNTIDNLLDTQSRIRLSNFHVTERIAGIIIVLLHLRDANDALVNAEVARSTDFAWLKVARFYWDTYGRKGWLSILDSTLPVKTAQPILSCFYFYFCPTKLGMCAVTDLGMDMCTYLHK